MTDTTTTLENRIRGAKETRLTYESEVMERREHIARIDGYINGLSETIELIKRDD